MKVASDPVRPDKKHQHWDKVVSACYLRILGHTQKETATAVGRSERTIRLWEDDRELWLAARAEARDRWFSDVEDASRGAVLRGLKAADSAELALRLLERLDNRLAPPRQRLEHTGENGAPLEISVTRRVVSSPKNRVAAVDVHSTNGNGNGNGRHA